MKAYIHTNICTQISTATFIITKQGKQPKCSSIDEQIKNMVYFYVVWHTTTQMNLENIMLHESSQSQKIVHLLFHSHDVSRTGKSVATGSGCLGLGVLDEMGSDCQQGWSFFLGQWKFQKSIVTMMHRLNILKPTKLYALKGCIVWLVNFISKLF